jgi:hypothetical protein
VSGSVRVEAHEPTLARRDGTTRDMALVTVVTVQRLRGTNPTGQKPTPTLS